MKSESLSSSVSREQSALISPYRRAVPRPFESLQRGTCNWSYPASLGVYRVVDEVSQHLHYATSVRLCKSTQLTDVSHPPFRGLVVWKPRQSQSARPVRCLRWPPASPLRRPGQALANGTGTSASGRHITVGTIIMAVGEGQWWDMSDLSSGRD
jgi:hypothetical protein